jgi:uncharacterized protein (TIGR01777 family)
MIRAETASGGTRVARIAITGSSGLIGTALRQKLEGGGHEVLRVRRGNRSDPSAMWDPGTGWVRDGALEGVDAVVHLAGANMGEKRWTKARKAELVRSRVDATRLLVDHLADLERKPVALISASAVGFYGSRGEETLTEESERGSGFLAGLVDSWEREALRAGDFGIRTVLVRTAPVLDSDEGMLAKMLMPFKLGAGGRIGNGKMWFPWISLADIVRVYERAIEDTSLRGPVNAMAPAPIRNAEFTRALGKAIHRPTLVPVPPLGLKLLFGGEMTDEMLMASTRAVPKRLQDAGFTFEHRTIDEALEAALG